MAVSPRFAGQKIQVVAPRPSAASVPPATHSVELYLDYCCPFSARMFKRLTKDVFPVLQRNASEAANGLCFIFRQQVQPWHPSSTLMHEAALAVLQLAPEKFWSFSSALFDAQKEYFDVSVVAETRNLTYRRLARLAASSVGLDEERVYKLLEIPDRAGDDGSLNVGNAVTNDLKYVTKVQRLVGVHVTPTVICNGVVQNDISSSFTAEQWLEWVGKNAS